MDGIPLPPCQDHCFLGGIFGIGSACSHSDEQDNFASGYPGVGRVRLPDDQEVHRGRAALAY